MQIPSSPSRRQSVSSSSYSHSIDIDCSTVPSVSCWLLPAISSTSLTSLYSLLFFSTLSIHPADNDSDVLIVVGFFVSFLSPGHLAIRRLLFFADNFLPFLNSQDVAPEFKPRRFINIYRRLDGQPTNQSRVLNPACPDPALQLFGTSSPSTAPFLLHSLSFFPKGKTPCAPLINFFGFQDT